MSNTTEKIRATESQLARFDAALRAYDTMIGRATARLKAHELEIYVHERPAFAKLRRQWSEKK